MGISVQPTNTVPAPSDSPSLAVSESNTPEVSTTTATGFVPSTVDANMLKQTGPKFYMGKVWTCAPMLPPGISEADLQGIAYAPMSYSKMSDWRLTLDTRKSKGKMLDGDYRESFSAVFSAKTPGTTDWQGKSRNSMPKQTIQGHWDDDDLGGQLGWQQGDWPVLEIGDTIGSSFDPFSPKKDPWDVDHSADFTLGLISYDTDTSHIYMVFAYETTQAPAQGILGQRATIYAWCQYS